MVAVYNVGKYIEQCARSLFEQTLEDIEIIFINDATPDNSVEIIEQALKDYPHRKDQVRFVHHEKNMKLPQTRLDGLKAARGEFVIFMDGDDYVEPKYAELLYNKSQETGADMVVCDYYHQYPNRTSLRRMVPEGTEEDGERLRDDILNWRVTHYLWCRLIKRNLFEENEITWSVGSFGEDFVMVSQTTYYAHKLAHVGEPLYHYRYNTNSIVRSDGEDVVIRRFNEYKANYEIVADFLHKNDLEEKYERLIFSAKLATKNKLKPLLGKLKYRWKYFITFPEINWIFLFGNKKHKPTWRDRAWFIVILLGFYPKHNKRINKYFRPSREFDPGYLY